jgi:membrane protein DedA with SNARE-associated domain
VVRTTNAVASLLFFIVTATSEIYTFVGSWIWCFVLAYVGAELGDRWDSSPGLRNVFHSLDVVILLLLVAGIGSFLWSHWPRRGKRTED